MRIFNSSEGLSGCTFNENISVWALITKSSIHMYGLKIHREKNQPKEGIIGTLGKYIFNNYNNIQILTLRFFLSNDCWKLTVCDLSWHWKGDVMRSRTGFSIYKFLVKQVKTSLQTNMFQNFFNYVVSKKCKHMRFHEFLHEKKLWSIFATFH